MPAQFVGCLDRDALPVHFEFVRQRMVEKVRWKLELPDDIELCQLTADALDPGVACVFAKRVDDSTRRRVLWRSRLVSLGCV
jgi:hypothetical protein